jgi:hypothetical protein
LLTTLLAVPLFAAPHFSTESKMKTRLPPILLLLAIALPATAASVACPDLATAVQVAACPADEELRYTFTGYCSDNNRSYKGDTDVCTDFQAYRKLKNVALWESADGNFNAYVSCDRAPAAVRALKPVAIRVARQGSITQLVCGYGEGLSFTWRTRATCRVDSTADCRDKPLACKADCE